MTISRTKLFTQFDGFINNQKFKYNKFWFLKQIKLFAQRESEKAFEYEWTTRIASRWATWSSRAACWATSWITCCCWDRGLSRSCRYGRRAWGSCCTRGTITRACTRPRSSRHERSANQHGRISAHDDGPKSDAAWPRLNDDANGPQHGWYEWTANDAAYDWPGWSTCYGRRKSNGLHTRTNRCKFKTFGC